MRIFLIILTAAVILMSCSKDEIELTVDSREAGWVTSVTVNYNIKGSLEDETFSPMLNGVTKADMPGQSYAGEGEAVFEIYSQYPGSHTFDFISSEGTVSESISYELVPKTLSIPYNGSEETAQAFYWDHNGSSPGAFHVYRFYNPLATNLYVQVVWTDPGVNTPKLYYTAGGSETNLGSYSNTGSALSKEYYFPLAASNSYDLLIDLGSTYNAYNLTVQYY